MGWFTRSEHPEEQLSAFIDGELDARQAEKVARHLAACPHCTSLADELRSAKTMLSELPREAPGRSFVLGPEHARQTAPAPVRAPARRSSFSFAPAVAATVLIGLLLADAISFSGVSRDESTSGGAAGAGSKAEFSRQSAEDSSAEAPVPAVAPGQGAPSTTNSGATADAAGAPSSAPSFRVPEAGSPVPQSGGGSGSGSTSPQAPPVPTVLLPPATGNNAPEATGPISSLGTDSPPSVGEADGFADNAAASDNDGSGLSTLRLLQILAAIALVASVFYVYVRPRLFERK